jgi:hypothetical protein
MQGGLFIEGTRVHHDSTRGPRRRFGAGVEKLQMQAFRNRQDVQDKCRQRRIERALSRDVSYEMLQNKRTWNAGQLVSIPIEHKHQVDAGGSTRKSEKYRVKVELFAAFVSCFEWSVVEDACRIGRALETRPSFWQRVS